jgi:quinol monooxygenase YgiN
VYAALIEQPVLIVSGKLYIMTGRRQEFLTLSNEAMLQGRRAPGCRDFTVTADPIEIDRVNVYEEWDSEQSLSDFRGEGPTEDLSAMIVKAEVTQHVISKSD